VVSLALELGSVRIGSICCACGCMEVSGCVVLMLEWALPTMAVDKSIQTLFTQSK